MEMAVEETMGLSCHQVGEEDAILGVPSMWKKKPISVQLWEEKTISVWPKMGIFEGIIVPTILYE